MHAARIWTPALLIAPAMIFAQTSRPMLPPVPRVDPASEIACRVVNVLDSGTVIVDIRGEKTAVTLLGAMIERRGPRLESVDQYLELHLSGEDVYVVYDPAHVQNDDRGRRAVYLFRAPDTLFINLELVRLGYVAADASIEYDHREVFRAYELRAKSAEKGIWSREAAEAESNTEKSKNSGKEETGASDGGSSAARIKVLCTKSGQKYHLPSCSFAKEGAEEITLEEARKRGLTPCSRCKPPP
jgi:endonuclease YncB( thermonuclease family)